MRWPGLVGNRVQEPYGYAAVVALEIPTKIYYVFDEFEFMLVDHKLDMSGNIQIEGLAPWLSKQQATYGCVHAAILQNDDMDYGFRRQIKESKHMVGRVRFAEDAVKSTDELMSYVLQQTALTNIRYNANGQLHKALQVARVSYREIPNPIISVGLAIRRIDGLHRKQKKSVQEDA